MRPNRQNPVWRTIFYLGLFFLGASAGVSSGLFPCAIALASEKHSSTSETKISASQPGQRPAANVEFVYFFDLVGGFVKVNPASEEEVAHGQIAAAREVIADQPNFDGCIFCNVRSSRSTQRLYAVVAKEARVSEAGTKHYLIVALDSADVGQAASAGIGESLADPPAILVRPDGKRLLASFQTETSNQPADNLRFAL